MDFDPFNLFQTQAEADEALETALETTLAVTLDRDSILITVDRDGHNVVKTDEREHTAVVDLNARIEFEAPDELFENLCKSDREQVADEVSFSLLVVAATVRTEKPQIAKKPKRKGRPLTIQNSRPRVPRKSLTVETNVEDNGFKERVKQEPAKEAPAKRKRVTKTATKNLRNDKNDPVYQQPKSHHRPKRHAREEQKADAVPEEGHQQNVCGSVCPQKNLLFQKLLQEASGFLVNISKLYAELDKPTPNIVQTQSLLSFVVKKYQDKQIEVFQTICEAEQKNWPQMLRFVELAWTGVVQFQNFKLCVEDTKYRSFLLKNLSLLYQAVIRGPQCLSLGDCKIEEATENFQV